MRNRHLGFLVLATFLAVGCSEDMANLTSPSGMGAGAGAGGPLSGAIFTTLVDGTRVNANIYEAKEDVYLDGGPGPNAPQFAAGLPDGDYYFQVTDPSGKDLLSTDHISCRRFTVTDGVISGVVEGTNYVKQKGDWVPVPCVHNTGVDEDHGAVTVQLFPYDDTPNPGGVYKVWVTRVEDYAGDPDLSPPDNGPFNVNGENWQPANVHGFIPSQSKTDNYKVLKKGKPFDPPILNIRKFHDRNLNGIQDEGEEDVTGWAVSVTDPTGVVNTVYTPAMIYAEEGSYTLEEEIRAGTIQTTSYLDGTQLSVYPAADPAVFVSVEYVSGETHEVVYGNVGVGSAEACKIYDRNGNGIADEGEPPVAGWQMQLTGTDVTGAIVGPTVLMTDATGCAVFTDLLPGTYEVTELMPAAGGWTATGALSSSFTIESSLDGSSMSGTAATVSFTNICIGTADFGTKGYWHNKNGLDELTQSDIDFVNGLVPYASPSDYFADGDEPFDGFFQDGVTPVASARGNWGEELAPEGTFQAEVYYFLVDSNGDGGSREQLAQQLLAFIFNVQHRLDGMDAAIQLADGTWVSASGLIADAIDAWTSGETADQVAIKDILNAFNESDAVSFISYYPCPVIY